MTQEQRLREFDARALEWVCSAGRTRDGLQRLCSAAMGSDRTDWVARYCGWLWKQGLQPETAAGDLSANAVSVHNLRAFAREHLIPTHGTRTVLDVTRRLRKDLRISGGCGLAATEQNVADVVADALRASLLRQHTANGHGVAVGPDGETHDVMPSSYALREICAAAQRLAQRSGWVEPSGCFCVDAPAETPFGVALLSEIIRAIDGISVARVDAACVNERPDTGAMAGRCAQPETQHKSGERDGWTESE